MAKLAIILVAVATIVAVGAKNTPSFVSCQQNILSALESIQLIVAKLEQPSGASGRSRRDTTFMKPEVCQVSARVLVNLNKELNSTLNAAEPQANSKCSVSDQELKATSTTKCKSVIKLIQCGVSHLKAAYAKASAVSGLDQQAKWESVVDVLRDTTNVITDLKKSYDENRRLELDALSAQLQGVKATLYCMEEVFRNKIEDTVVDKILLGELSEAETWFKQLKMDLDLLRGTVTKAFNRASNGASRVGNAQKIVSFLTALNAYPQLVTHGANHLIKQMEATKDWPNAYVQFKILLNRLANVTCLPTVARIRLYSLKWSLEQALQRHISANAEFIKAGHSSAAKNFFISKIGNDRNIFPRVIHTASIAGSSVSNVTSFLEEFNDAAYSVDALRIIFAVMKSRQRHATVDIFKLNAHYKQMHLSDSSLWKNIRDAMLEVYAQWGKHVFHNCHILRALASQHGGDFEALEVFRSGYNGLPSRANIVADCIETMPEVLQGIEGYGGLLKKLDELEHIDTFEYMGIVERFRDYADMQRTENPRHYPNDIVKNIRNRIPKGVRDFFFNNGRCHILSDSPRQFGLCLGVSGDSYQIRNEADSRYNSYLGWQFSSNDDCKMRFRKRFGQLSEYQIISERTNTYFFVSDRSDARFKCYDDEEDICRRTYFWGTSENDFNGWFKIRPYSRGTKFAFMNTFYPGSLYAHPKGIFSQAWKNVDVIIDDSYDDSFWTISCAVDE